MVWPRHPMRGGGEDDDAQVDGEVAYHGAAMSAQPWLRGGITPWHMWGNTETLAFAGGGGIFGEPVVGAPTRGQLCRVAYKRPETFHWVFQSVLLEAPEVPIPGANIEIVVFFDLIVGIGRSTIVIPAFETHTWAYNNPDPIPINQPLTTTTARGNRRLDTSGTGAPNDYTVISEITAEDIQLSCRVGLSASSPGPFNASARVSAHFAPKNHVRPDWFIDGPQEIVFPGAEIAGK